MKKINKKHSLQTIVLLFSATLFFTILSGCSKEKDIKASTTDSKTNTIFSLISDKCNAIGELNISEIIKIELFQKQIAANKHNAYLQKWNAAGLNLDNIDNICFGVIPPNLDKVNTNPDEGIILFNTISKVSLDKFIKLEIKESGKKITTIKIADRVIYLIPNEKGMGNVFLTQIDDKLIAAGSKDMITATIELSQNKGKSALDNKELMNLTVSNKNHMLWVACTIPEQMSKNAGKGFPKIEDAFISADYNNDILTIGGIVSCKTKEDVQNVLAPIQMVSNMVAMNPNSGLTKDDISIISKGKELIIKLSIPKTTLENYAKQQMAVMNNRVVTSPVLSQPMISNTSPNDIIVKDVITEVSIPSSTPGKPNTK